MTEGNEKKNAAKTLIEIVNTARKSMVNIFYLKINFCGLKKWILIFLNNYFVNCISKT